MANLCDSPPCVAVVAVYCTQDVTAHCTLRRDCECVNFTHKTIVLCRSATMTATHRFPILHQLDSENALLEGLGLRGGIGTPKQSGEFQVSASKTNPCWVFIS